MPAEPPTEARPEDETEHEDRVLTEDELVDEASRDSFPASDPPAF